MTKSNLRALLSELGVYDPKKATKKQLEALLDESFKSVLNIAVPVGATKRQLQELIWEYFSEAAVVATDKGLDFRRTDKPTQVYIANFTIDGTLNIRADSEESANKWLENELDGFNCSSFGFTVEDCWTEFDDVYKADEDEEVARPVDYDLPPVMPLLTNTTA